MAWKSFHHPDFCAAVARRRLTLEILDLLDGVGTLLATRGRSLGWNESYPNRAAYRAAQYRLRKAGLVAYRRGGGRSPDLVLTRKGRELLPEVSRPQRHWDRKWHGRWYVLAYDVPETERQYRDALRQFLKRMRMGCLQGSVWVTPRDIRPQYSDLAEAAGLRAYSFLFEAETVLGRSDAEVVWGAWDMEGLGESQAWYCEVCEENLRSVRARSATEVTLTVRGSLNLVLCSQSEMLASSSSFHRGISSSFFFGSSCRTPIRHAGRYLRNRRAEAWRRARQESFRRFSD